MTVEIRERALKEDIAAIQKISIVPIILDVICRSTGMGFAAVARVTEERWITCSQLDKINFGLKPGDELPIATTICNEIRRDRKSVIIDHVAEDKAYCTHHTPLQYGFQSYISIPIFRKDGSFFGTLCAIDPAPAELNTPEIVGMYELFAELISFHLQALDQLELTERRLLEEREARIIELEQKNQELQRMNKELQSFAYAASHDLQEPLRKIQTFAGLIQDRDYSLLTESGQDSFRRMQNSARRMQLLLNDLVRYSSVREAQEPLAEIALQPLVDSVIEDHREVLQNKDAAVTITVMCNAKVIPLQFNQLLGHLVGNAIKFARPEVQPVINISGAIGSGADLANGQLAADKDYFHLSVTDNGIGFDENTA